MFRFNRKTKAPSAIAAPVIAPAPRPVDVAMEADLISRRQQLIDEISVQELMIAEMQDHLIRLNACKQAAESAISVFRGTYIPPGFSASDPVNPEDIVRAETPWDQEAA